MPQPRFRAPWLKPVWAALWADKVPLLINIIFVLGTAIGTYYLAPHINEKFERQKLQSEYILENLRQLNADIADLYAAVTIINYKLAHGAKVEEPDKEKAREVIVRLNWKVVETAAVLKDVHDVRTLAAFQMELNKVEQRLDAAHDVDSGQQLVKSVRDFSAVGVKLIEAIAQRAELSSPTSPPSAAPSG